MPSSTVPFTLVYRNPEASSPVFLAGSFTEPPWLPQEMRHITHGVDQPGFQAQVQVEPGREYQFKFRLGEGDWWVLDESSPIVTDENGNRNNLLRVPLDLKEASSRPSDPSPPLSIPQVGTEETDMDEPLELPLLAHERLGAYVADESDMSYGTRTTDAHQQSPLPISKNHTFDEIDMGDPTIEKFPSDRSSIMDALRKIQTSTGNDHIRLEQVRLSLRTAARDNNSADSADEALLSSGSQSPSSYRRRDSRLSHGSSFGGSRSAISMGSIAEEDQKMDEEETLGSKWNEGSDVPPSDDEGLVVKPPTRLNPTQTTSSVSSSQNDPEHIPGPKYYLQVKETLNDSGSGGEAPALASSPSDSKEVSGAATKTKGDVWSPSAESTESSITSQPQSKREGTRSDGVLARLKRSSAIALGSTTRTGRVLDEHRE